MPVQNEVAKLQVDLNEATHGHAKGKRSASEISDLERQIYEKQAKLERLQSEQSAAFTKAIHMAIKAYDIDPVHEPKTSVMRWTKGREIEWLLVMHEPGDREMRAANGAVKTVAKPTKLYDAATYFDGTTYVDRAAFKRGVAWLGATLYHEHLHFEQYTTPGTGDKTTHDEREVKACEDELKKEVKTIFFDEKKDSGMIGDIEAYKDESHRTRQLLTSRKFTAGEWRNRAGLISFSS